MGKEGGKGPARGTAFPQGAITSLGKSFERSAPFSTFLCACSLCSSRPARPKQWAHEGTAEGAGAPQLPGDLPEHGASGTARSPVPHPILSPLLRLKGEESSVDAGALGHLHPHLVSTLPEQACS